MSIILNLEQVRHASILGFYRRQLRPTGAGRWLI